MILQMCFGSPKNDENDVSSVYDRNGEMSNEEHNHTPIDLVEHNDNPFLNRHVQYGILGFRYETKNESILVYSSVEAKTFCMIMRLGPMKT